MQVSAAQQPRDLATREAATRPRMDACELDDSRAPVAFGRRAVPQLFEELRQPGADRRRRALASLCDLLHHQELIYQAVTGGDDTRKRNDFYSLRSVSYQFTISQVLRNK